LSTNLRFFIEKLPDTNNGTKNMQITRGPIIEITYNVYILQVVGTLYWKW